MEKGRTPRPDTPDARVELRGVTKSFGVRNDNKVTAADHIDLTIASHSLVALTGPSGSGKSTILHLIGSIERPDEGTIKVGSTLVTSLRRRELAAYRRRVGFVFQRYNLIPALTAIDNVMAPVLPFHTDWDKRQRAQELLDRVGLSDRAESLPGRMSGGEQQRIALARALIQNPTVLLADEPTGNLDSSNATNLLDLVTSLHEKNPMTVVIATHDPSVAARCQRLIRLRDGKVTDDVDLTSCDPPNDTLRQAGWLG